MIQLGVNVDHVATVRNARGGEEPDPIQAALLAEAHGADGITAHLREDRRHIRDEDMWALKKAIKTRLNMEMAATDEMIAIALELQPYMVTLVPERREELTTEGGLNVAGFQEALRDKVAQLTQAGILVSMFIDPDNAQLDATKAVGAPFIELHTGEYANQFLVSPQQAEPALRDLHRAADYGAHIGLRVNAGHGLTLDNVSPILSLNGLEELNIGHHLIAQSVFKGLGPVVNEMKALLQSNQSAPVSAV